MLQKNQEINQTYIILEEIGSGGGGTVFKAYHKNLEKPVVLKKIHANLLKSNVRAEVDILKNLKSPYLPQVFDFIQQNDDVYTVMDYIPGKSLKEMLEEKNCFPQKQVLKWMDQLCQAVEQLHIQEHPIIHGDIKPANIMLTPKDDICLIDFNISGDFQESGVVGFTRGYAAPEQVASAVKRQQRSKRKGLSAGAEAAAPVDAAEVKGVALEDATEVEGAAPEDATEVEGTALEDATEVKGTVSGDATEVESAVPEDATEVEGTPQKRTADLDKVSDCDKKTETEEEIHVDTRSDIYSIGATAYHLLTGQKPDPGNIRPILELTDQIEDSFAFLIMKCLEQNPEKRYQSIQELHKAVLNVHKSSKEYSRLLHRQFFIRLLLIVGVVGCLGLAGSGQIRMKKERMARYEEYLALMDQARQQQEYEQVEEYYQLAVALFPDRGGAPLKKMEALYQQRKYEEVIAFADSSVGNVVSEEQNLGEMDSLRGSSYLEMEEYDKAEEAFQEALAHGLRNSQVYCDYAVSLARMNRTDEAKEQLEQAISYQLATDSIYYVQGEIYFSQGNWTEASDSFRSCIADTDDEYMKMRAYLMCDRVLVQEGGKLEGRKELLEEAQKVLPVEYQNAVLEDLAQVYMDLSNESGDSQYDLQAVDILKKITQNGWGIYLTYNNIAVLYQKNRMYTEENEILNTMLKLFGEQYNTYKRLAFMEAGAQMLLENEERSFTQFAEYYEKAVALYEEQLSNNQTDLEMISLEDLYKQAVDGGWIAEE